MCPKKCCSSVATPEPTHHLKESTSHVVSTCYVTGILHFSSHLILTITFWLELLFLYHKWGSWGSKRSTVAQNSQSLVSELEPSSLTIKHELFFTVAQNLLLPMAPKNPNSQNIPPIDWWWLLCLQSKIHSFLSLGISEHICSQDSHLSDCCGKSQDWLK